MLQGGDKLTLNVSGTVPSPSIDDSVTVTHFSLDSWGKIEQKTTPFSPKVANHSQNPFTNPFMNNTATEITDGVEEIIEQKREEAEEVKTNTNPFIDSNPFLGLLNPFNEVGFSQSQKSPNSPTEIKAEPEKLDAEKGNARVIKTEEIQTTTTTVTHKVSEDLPKACNSAVLLQNFYSCFEY